MALPSANGLGIPLTQGPVPGTIGIQEIFAVAGSVFARLTNGTVIALGDSGALLHGIARFTGAGGVFLVPPAVTQLFVTGAAGGGGGGGPDFIGSTGAGGGGAGQGVVAFPITVVSGETLTISASEGGAGGAVSAQGVQGGTLTITGSFSGLLLTLIGGFGGFADDHATNPGSGGPPGGIGGQAGLDRPGGDRGASAGDNAAGGIGGIVFDFLPLGAASASDAVNGGGGAGFSSSGNPAMPGGDGFAVIQW